MLDPAAAGDLGSDVRPAVTRASSGVVVVVWESSSDDGGALGSDFDIMLSRSLSQGELWTAAAVLNSNAGTDTGNDRNPSVAAGAGGEWVAVWRSTDRLDATIGGDEDILFARSSDSGATWTPPQALNTTAAVDGQAIDRRPWVAADGGGRWVALWESDLNLDGALDGDIDVLFSSSVDGGLSWSDPLAVADNAAADVTADLNPVVVSGIGAGWLALWDSDAGTDGVTGGRRLLLGLPANACTPAPATTCLATAKARAAKLKVADKDPDRKDSVAVKWAKGEEVAAADLGDPLSDTDLTLCLYDSAAGGSELASMVLAVGGSSCRKGKACWSSRGGGYKFADRDGRPAGMRKLVLKPGVAGKASIKLKAKGENLAVPALPLVVPVSHQVRASNGNCWGADYSLPAINSVSSFKSRSD